MPIPSLNTSTTREKPEKDNKVALVKHFLADNYTIRINRFNPDQKEIVSHHRRYRYAPTLSEIALHFYEEHNLQAKTIIKEVLNSLYYSEEYNPIEEYFNELNYGGTSHIDLLVASLTPKHRPIENDEEENEDLTQKTERMYYIIKKWFVAAYACSVKHISNHVALGFIGDTEGLGKTRLARFICPPVLHDMIQLSNENEAVFNFEKAFATNFIVLFDEGRCITNRFAEVFKSKVSSDTCSIKYRDSFSAIEVPRIANAIFTQNNKTGKHKGFLTDSLGYRRYGCIDLQKINFDLFDKVNIDQVWAEAKMLYENNFEFMWNEDDYIDFKEFNVRFAMTTNIVNIMEEYFTIPLHSSEGERMTPSDISNYLRQLNGAHKLNADQKKDINEVEIGKALNYLNFEQKRTKTGRYYIVKKKVK